MPYDDFMHTVKPRVNGTINLHNALEDTNLDFFLLWSSWATLLNSPSQTNYAASNAFMDTFARYRRGLGRPATSMCLGQILDVGIVSHMPAYQEHVLRMGMYGNTEAEFLNYCDASICESLDINKKKADITTDGHVLVGFEAAGLLANDKRYPIANMPWRHDPRFAKVNATVANTQMMGGIHSETTGRGLTAIEDESECMVVRIHKQIARLLYIQMDDIGVGKPISSYGIDSMVAAELRNWLLRTFAVYVSLLNLLSPSMTILKLADEIARESEKSSGDKS
jgi:hypothetical protein